MRSSIFHNHRIRRVVGVLIGVSLLGGCARTGEADAPSQPKQQEASMTAPIADRRAHEVGSPHGVRPDDYFWLRDDERKAVPVLEYLAAENRFHQEATFHLRNLEESVYSEIVGKIKQDDASVPQVENGYWYYVRFEEGKEYPVHARRAGSLEAPEEVLLDGNAMAEGRDFFQIGGYEVSPNNKLLAWAEDTVGRRQWVIRFKDLETGEVFPTSITNAEAGFAWANDNRTLVYVEKDPETLLGFRVRKHSLGQDPQQDPVVYEETDRSFYMGVGRSRSGRFLMIGLDSTVSNEFLVADASDPALEFRVVLPRERDHEYSIEDNGDDWIIRTNAEALNFRVVRVPMEKVRDRNAWRDIVPHRDDAFVEDFTVFDQHLAVEERSGGLRNLRIHRWADGDQHLIRSEEPTYSMWAGNNPEPGSGLLRFHYSSLTTPATTYDYNLDTRTRDEKKRDPVLGDFDPARYRSELIWVTARDGKTSIPVSLLYRADLPAGVAAPLYQYAYGSYGLSSDPTFSISRLSLVDRGVIYAIAHVRGGQEMGRAWYDDGRLLNKHNTFTDFIDVTRHLVAEGRVDKDRVAAMGGSAGGLLMGAVANMAPEDYRAMVAHVPFVDVVTTMLDDSIPLTTNEYDEWGNPTDKAYYDYMLTYSPYDNVAEQDYPALLVTTGLWDSQVQYWEPAKWVAKLRTHHTGDSPILLKTNMEAGHGGRSGRFQRIRETAEEFAFVIDQLDVPEEPLPWPVPEATQ
jgi:oligopeptidase B